MPIAVQGAEDWGEINDVDRRTRQPIEPMLFRRTLTVSIFVHRKVTLAHGGLYWFIIIRDWITNGALMKLATFIHNHQQGVGALSADGASLAPLTQGGTPVTDVLALIRSGEATASLALGEPVALTDVRLLAPIPRPSRNIFCVGKNYINHAQEFTKSGFDAGHANPADAIPESPIVFTKSPETVIADGEPVWAAEGVTEALDYEAELAVVIGKGGRGISKADALKHVFGYTILNDVTARDWQKRHKQWFLGKSFDTFAPMGPVLVTADDIDAANLDVRCWINGELRQEANTRDLIFDIPTLIETISAGITLHPGDIIATGTPEGVGIGFNPPRFLKVGDRMRIEISEIGVLENEVGA
ncbi:fumarylacetoacetate hydrolase family protein [Luteibacter sp. 22Crub2.1]|uniref:fumarylacetoacetate hydrolase family protein n=1 Tax=Luteibacter sp. 22Crub2.1 TaxID=1283288 RepID=UPI0020CA461C|nr:fumarylacetoacetate hydrolase family protein [Luteibacter sp. 22Crub2.1]